MSTITKVLAKVARVFGGGKLLWEKSITGDFGDQEDNVITTCTVYVFDNRISVNGQSYYTLNIHNAAAVRALAETLLLAADVLAAEEERKSLQ